MSKVCIVTDSAAALDEETCLRLDIHVLPLTIHLGSESFREGIDISSEDFLTRLRSANSFATQSPPATGEFHQIFENLSQNGSSILSIHMSEKLGGTYDAARQAAESFLGRCKIEVIDSETISLGQGALVKAAAEAAQAGESLDDIVRLMRGMTPHIYSIFFVESLDYLERGGRIGVAQAILGTMLGIKPLLTIEDGEIVPLEKVRSREKAVEKLFEFIAEFSHIEELAILQDRYTQETTDLLERLELLFPGREIPTHTYNPSLAVHLGPTAMGAMIFEGLF